MENINLSRDPFPYVMHVSPDVDKLTALSWRLRGQVDNFPRRWLWIIALESQAKYEDHDSDSLVNIACSELGRRMVDHQYGLVCGGTYHEDEALSMVLQSFFEAFDQTRADIKNYHRFYEFGSRQPEIATNVIYRVKRETGLQEMAEMCHAAILVSGSDGSLELAHLCLEHNTPVYPIVPASGAAREFAHYLEKEIDSKERDLIYGKAFDPSVLSPKDLKVIPALNTILQLLDERLPVKAQPKK